MVEVASLLLAFVALLPIYGTLDLAIGRAPGPECVVVAMLIAFVIAHGRATSRALRPSLVALAIVVVACLISASLFDVSWDGQVYHRLAVDELVHGWNPLYAPEPPEQTSVSIFLRHYPKASWIAGAILARTSGSIEAGKALGLMLLVAAALFTRHAIELHLPSARRWAGWLAASPVALAQLCTFYVDGLLASAMLVAAALMAIHCKEPRRKWLVLFALDLTFLSNLKFTGLLYATLLALALVVTQARPQRRLAITTAIIALSLAVLVGFNPYLTNLFSHHNPFYPLFDKHADDILTVGANADFLQRHRFSQLLWSVFCQSSNHVSAIPPLKLPFTVHLGELIAFTAPDVRFGGFGPLFSAIVLLGAIAFVQARAQPRTRPLALVVLAIVASVLATRAAFWARLAPQLWWAPLVGGIALAQTRDRWLGRALVAVVAVDVALVAAIALGTTVVVNRARAVELDACVKQAAGAPLEVALGDFVSTRRELEARRVRYRLVERATCAAPLELEFTKVAICLPGGVSPRGVPSLGEIARGLARF